MVLPCRIEMLGGLRVLQFESKIDRFQSQKTGALLAFLALNPSRSHAREALAEMLWPEGDPKAIRNRLNQAISSLRRQLHPPESPGTVLVTDHHFVGLNVDAVATDVAEFHAAIKKAEREVQRARKVEHLEKAVALYGGELLSGYYEEWVLPERLRVADQYSNALTDLVQLFSKSGEPDRAIEFAHALHKLDPLDELPHVQLMDLYLRADRPKSTIQHFEQMDELFGANGLPLPESATNLLKRAEKEAHRDYPTTRPAKLPAQSDRSHSNARRNSVPVTLPRVFTKFVGRAEELAVIGTAFNEGAALLTILGVGGCGKTRLAIEAAWRLSESYGGRIVFVPLSNVVDANQILPEIARYVITESDGLLDVEAALVRTLTEMDEVLLILDNFEQLAESGADRVLRLLRQVPNLQCLVTSRHALARDEEVLLELKPLPLPKADEHVLFELASNPSIALFVSRAQAVRPDFQLTERTAGGVASLCRKLEGLPLALELAAGWSRVLTPTQMLDQVTHRFDLLESRRKDISPRHRSMRAAIDGSFELLSPELRETFVRLGIFAGSFSLDAATHVCPGIDLVLSLEALSERSLIRSDDSGDGLHFSMLETLQAYACDQMTGDVAADCGWLHADFYRGVVLEDREFGVWRETIDRESQNIFAALDWLTENGHASRAIDLAVALRPYWEAKGRATEGRERLEDLLENDPSNLSATQRGSLLTALGQLAWIQGDYEDAKQRFERALPMLERTDAQRALMDAQFGLQLEAHRIGEYAKARAYLESNLAIAESLGDRKQLSRCWVALGNAAVEELRWDEARDNYTRSLDLARLSGDKDRIGHALNNLGNLAVLSNQPAAARRWLGEGLELFDAAGHRWHSAMGHLAFAKLEMAEGNPDLARAHLRESLLLAPEENLVVWRALLQFAILFAQTGRDSDALQLFAYVRTLREQIGETLMGVEMRPFEEWVSILRERMDVREFEQEWEVGQRLTRWSIDRLVM